MDRRAFLVGFAALMAGPRAAWGSVACQPSAQGRTLCSAALRTPVPDTLQAEGNGPIAGWTTAIHLCLLRRGHALSRDAISAALFGPEVKRPGSPRDVLAALDRGWTDATGLPLSTTGVQLGADPASAATLLAEDEPLILATRRRVLVLTGLSYLQNAAGHAVVTQASVWDPTPGEGAGLLDPAAFATYLLARVTVEVKEAGG